MTIGRQGWGASGVEVEAGVDSIYIRRFIGADSSDGSPC